MSANNFKELFNLTLFLFLIILLSANNANAQAKIDINPVAKKHLTMEQIEALSASEIIALNYMFTSSFIVDTSSIIYKKWINDNDAIDVALLNQRRKQSERTFYRHENYPGFVIELLSWDELDNQINSILNNPENSK